jgi:hypothetical protein
LGTKAPSLSFFVVILMAEPYASVLAPDWFSSSFGPKGILGRVIETVKVARGRLECGLNSL